MGAEGGGILLGLRVRTLGPPLAIVAVLVMVSGWFGVDRVLSRFAQLESKETERVQVRARHVLEDRGTDLEFKGKDWARWDDAANWLEGRNPSFPTTNLEDSTLSNMGQDELFYWDTALSLRSGLGRVPGGVADTSLERELRALASNGRSPQTGMVRAGRNLYLATLQKVLLGSGKGPVRGWFGLARRMGLHEDQALGRVLQTPGCLHLPGASDFSPSPAFSARDSLTISVQIPLLNPGTAELDLHLDRPLHRLGNEAARGFLFQFALSVLLALAAALVLLERLVLRRIAHIAHGVERIGDFGETDIRVLDPRRDEIGNLSRRIDEMVARHRLAHLELRAALEKAESAAQARSQFLACVTHELRTPLNGVIGLTEHVMKGRLDSEQREALQLSREAALGLLETINGVLEYSRLEKGLIELVLEESDLPALVVDTAKILAPVADAKNLDLLVFCDPRIPRSLRIDAARLRQILNNLVGNAVKFTSQGRVAVSVDLTDCDEAFARIGFEVSDTGVGIPPARQEAIFEPFQQSSAETAIRFGGTGLGLTIARDLARAMGGRIEVESAPGAGSRFRFDIRVEIVDPAPSGSGMPPVHASVHPDLSDPLQQAHLRLQLQVAGVGEGDGILVTDSVERALAHPGPKVVLVRPSRSQAARVVLTGDRVEVLTLPCGMRTLFFALERVGRPSATVFVAASGRILREVVRGMLEREGMRVVAPGRLEDAASLLAASSVDVVVQDLDDPDWDALSLSDLPAVWIGDARDDRSGPQVAKPVRAEDLLAAVLGVLASAARKG
jgi:signal transduction histidine kinase